jgi:hypothetical protein
LENHDRDICRGCYWAFPEDYYHIAMRDVRRLDLTWQDQEVKDYDNLKKKSEDYGAPLPDFVKQILQKNI